jgi:hypothetical protein
MKKITLLALSLLFVSNCARAEFFPMPDLGMTSKTRFEAVEKNTGKKLWEATQTRSIMYDKGKRFLSIVEEGYGLYSGSKTPTSWRFEGYYYTIPGLTPYYSIRVVSSESGETLLTENLVYDHNTNKIFYSRDDRKKGKVEDKEFPLKYDIVDNFVLGTALLSYNFNEKKDVRFHQITEDQSIYTTTAGYRGKEYVATSSGSVECHKIELTVDLGALSFVGAFLPKLYFWYSNDDPTEFVQYEGLESGLGSPYVIIRAVATGRKK